MYLPSERETGAHVIVPAVRLLLCLVLGALAGMGAYLWLVPGRPAAAMTFAAAVAAATAWPVSRVFPRGLLRRRWAMARAVRRHGWDAASPAWTHYAALLSRLSEDIDREQQRLAQPGYRSRTRRDVRQAAAVEPAREFLRAAHRLLIDARGPEADDLSYPKGRARLQAYRAVLHDLATAATIGARTDAGQAERPAVYLDAFVAEFGAARLARAAPLWPQASEYLQARWAAGERSIDLLAALTTLAAMTGRMWQEAIDTGLPVSGGFLHTLDPQRWERDTHVGWSNDPALLVELVQWLARRRRYEEALAVARGERDRGNEFAAAQIERVERWQATGRDPTPPRRPSSNPFPRTYGVSSTISLPPTGSGGGFYGGFGV
ncbi:hypothetical protein [Actinoplanes teichomyceticus]|uniref:Uncharacterized protein n=1 Tax=Actinoplanes teichomyceticus TaxID=1867 RepID=A0A561VMW0_ACTTI|nr:hypothetical protein [Actinoplanes teichomyceticus]TWG12945.1 hypothetical protein FHX34_105813 [Actinoplanes teichomyceticus]GIF13699.1 hypothetical protein Ate01nite_37310 [Actinoplanes teichomyceticus]